MPRTKRPRKRNQDLKGLLQKISQRGAFTPAELAAAAGFSQNRARQVLEEVRGSKLVVPLGQRRSVRGKPATLWGRPGTRLSAADLKARPRSPRSEPKVRRANSDPGALGPLLDFFTALIQRGIQVTGPAGLSFHLAIAPQGPSEKRPRKPTRRRRARPAAPKPPAKPAAKPPETPTPPAPTKPKKAKAAPAKPKRKPAKRPTPPKKKAAAPKASESPPVEPVPPPPPEGTPPPADG